MSQFVEARRDISLEYPVIISGPESMNLSDRVLSPVSRTETVTDRCEIRLEDRLQHQQQRRLNRAVHRRGDTEAPELAASGFGNQSLPHRKWRKCPCLQFGSNVAQKC